MKLDVRAIPSGDVTLSALRYVPDGPMKPTALIFTHGFTSGKYSLDLLASYLAGRGYLGLTFDCVGHKLGGTGGEMRHIVQAAENLRDALAWLRANEAVENVVLIGHSMGGVATLQVAAWEQQNAGPPPRGRLAGLVCMCVGTEPSRGFESVIGKTMLAQRSDYVAGAPALQLLTELDTLILTAAEIGGLPALFIAAKQDVLVSPARVGVLAERAGSAATLMVIDSSHLEAPDRSRSTIAQWLEML